MNNEQKLSFFGTLHQILSLSEKSLREISLLWESGQMRLHPDDLELLNRVIGEINKNLKKVAKYNHSRFGLITNESVENKT